MEDFTPSTSHMEDLNVYCDELSTALKDGLISEEQWYDMRRDATAELYLSRDNPRGQSGHGGDHARWLYTRVLMILEALYKDGTFLDVGCANGHLIECLHNWTRGSGLEVEFYGLDFSDKIIEFARKRLPDFKKRLFVGNAATWKPEEKFDYVHAHEISYAPADKQREFLEHLLKNYLNPGGRLIIGPWAVHRDGRELEENLASWGYEPTGYILKSHGKDTSLTRKMIWFDKRG